jgi:ribosomal protein L5
VQYREQIVPALMKQFGYKTRMQVPRVTKITLNMGVGEAVADKKILENASATCRRSPARNRSSRSRASRSPPSRSAPAIRWAAW